MTLSALQRVLLACLTLCLSGYALWALWHGDGARVGAGLGAMVACIAIVALVVYVHNRIRIIRNGH